MMRPAQIVRHDPSFSLVRFDFVVPHVFEVRVFRRVPFCDAGETRRSGQRFWIRSRDLERSGQLLRGEGDGVVGHGVPRFTRTFFDFLWRIFPDTDRGSFFTSLPSLRR